MYNQFFSGETTTRAAGMTPDELSQQVKSFIHKKALGEDVSGFPVEVIEENERIKRKNMGLPEHHSESNPIVIPKEVSEIGKTEVDQSKLKKHDLNFFPDMNEEDYLALKNNIKENGFDKKYPVWLYQGDIIDGWNRHRACTELNVRPVYKDFNGNDSDAISFVVRSNNRRNLTPSQRACVAIEYESLFNKLKSEALEKQKEGGRKKVRQSFAEPKSDDNKTDSKIAKLFGTNRTYVNKARKVRDEDPEMFEKIKVGKKKFGQINKKRTYTDEYENSIPDEYEEKVKAVFGISDLKSTISDVEQDGGQVTIDYTHITNELDKEWHGNVFVNPQDLNTGVDAFIEKFIDEYDMGHLTQAIILITSSAPSEFFHKLMRIAKLVCFTDERFKSIRRGKKVIVTYGKIFFYVGNNEESFTNEFSDLGIVMRKA